MQTKNIANYPQFPLYVVSKGRYKYLYTHKALCKMKVHHFMVVEEQEHKLYSKNVNSDFCKVLILDSLYKKDYETCDKLGETKSTGPGPARNFAWAHSVKNKHKWHWVMDDNIRGFFRFNNNLKVPCRTHSFWRVMEDFCLRYENVAMAGPCYFFFVPRKTKKAPLTLNTRIYSCNLIRNDVPCIWRGRYNEDTILSIDLLKKKWCTIQFNTFLQDKMETQIIKGGNTDEFYHKEGEVKKNKKYAKLGTYNKSKMLVDVHPDISRIKFKFGRVHHIVNYRIFKHKLIRKSIKVNKKINNYGMTLKNLKGQRKANQYSP